jgi:flagellar export protein FliJ
MLKYKIDKIIEIKDTMIRDKEREIKDTITEIDSILHDIGITEETIHKGYNSLGTAPMKGSDFGVLKDYLEYLERKKKRLIEEKEDREKKINRLKMQLFELAKEKKMFEKLKSKIMASLRKSFNRREQKLLDDIALRIDT